MEDIILKTPGGWTVTIKPELTYGEFIQLQQMLAAGMKINPETKEITSELEGKSLLEGQRKTMEFLITKITDPQGGEITNIMGAIEGMPMRDGQAIADKVNEISGKAQLPKKGGS